MLRRCSLSTSCAVDRSSSAVRPRTLQLPRLAVQLRKHLDLRAQHLRHDRHWNVVDRPHLIAAKPVEIADLDRGDEDHRGLLETWMLTDHGRKLKTVELGHADIDQDDGDVVLEQDFQRLAAGGRNNEILAQLLQDHLIRQKLRRLIVDEEDVDLFMISHQRHRINDEATCGWREAAVRY
jgi:hypothetical protein